jgi:hypothetical protein
MTATYLPYCAALNKPVDVPCFVLAFICFGVPVGYAFGVVPALLAGVMYCGGLTAMATLRPGILLRTCLGAISGGLVGGAWFHAVIGPESHGYGSVAALVVALLSLRWPPVRTRNVSLHRGIDHRQEEGIRVLAAARTMRYGFVRRCFDRTLGGRAVATGGQ